MHIFLILGWSLYYWVLRVLLYIISPLKDKYFVNVFSQSVAYRFLFIMESFKEQKFLIFADVQLINCFFSCFCAVWRALPDLRSQRFSPMYSSKSFTFRFVINVGLTFVQIVRDKRLVSFFFFFLFFCLWRCDYSSTICWEDLPFLFWIMLAFSWKISWSFMSVLFLDSILFHCLCVYPFTNAILSGLL